MARNTSTTAVSAPTFAVQAKAERIGAHHPIGAMDDDLQGAMAALFAVRPRLVGSEQCNCASCGRVFASVSAFDGHRRGPLANRICR